MASSNPQLNDVHQRNVKVLAQYKANLVDIDKTDAWKNAVDKLAVWLSDRRAYYLLALPLVYYFHIRSRLERPAHLNADLWMS
jgi:hypothetical protein